MSRAYGNNEKEIHTKKSRQLITRVSKFITRVIVESRKNFPKL